MRVGLTLWSNLLESSLAVGQAVSSTIGFKVESVTLVSAGFDVGTGQVLLRVFGEVPAAEVLRHALKEGNVDIDGLAIVLNLKHALVGTLRLSYKRGTYPFICTSDVRLVWMVGDVDLVAILRAAWKSHVCSSLHTMAVQSLAYYSKSLVRHHTLMPGKTYNQPPWL